MLAPWYESLIPQDESFMADLDPEHRVREPEHRVDELEPPASDIDEAQTESPSLLISSSPVTSDISIDAFVPNGLLGIGPHEAAPQPSPVSQLRSDSEAPTTSIGSHDTASMEQDVANVDPHEVQALPVNSTLSTTFTIGNASLPTSSQRCSSNIGVEQRKRPTRRQGVPYASREDCKQMVSSANSRHLDLETASEVSLSCVRDRSTEEKQERKRARALRKLIKRQIKQDKENESPHQKCCPTGTKLRFNPSMDDLANALSASTIKDSSSQSSAEDDLLAAFSSFRITNK
ncbi:hypothetical protein WOLCODRAFT_21418 [Wolfiporia cocos MD-104 SS10]|uniref:Uncharacterized protein n=1 Tax=Wolfiporia cocos (strain MD-104) TaxID=742152 RepID=A0A2H3JKK1_WOLCO|nr:hypothetical protein WOLCODRAFT_21418 [Wolfiporia cocos MD-104 SS10]